MRIKCILTGFVGLMLMLASCSTPKNVVYFPELTQGTIVEASQVLDVKVRPDDKISIIVSTQDPTISGLFNLVNLQNGVSMMGSDGKQVSGGNMSSSATSLYSVDSKGDINFPVIGKIHVAGLTREQIAEKITNLLVKGNYVKDPIVTVEYANMGVSVMGEVKSPGRYLFNKNNLTIIDALAMAGDLTIDGERSDILVMRSIGNGKQEAYRVSLLDADALAASPVYYMQQDDVIYVSPNLKKQRETTPNGNSPFTPSFWISIVSVLSTVTTLVITLAK